MAVGKTKRNLIHAAAFILMEVAALAMIFYNAELQRSWMARGINSFNAVVWGAVENIGRYTQLREENKLLAEQNHYLMTQLESQRRLDPHRRLSDTLGHWQFLPAEIIKHQFKGQHSYFLLNRGENDGVQVGSGVVTAKGVIGVVDAVSSHYAYVRSFFNAGMTVSARVDSTGVVAPLVWEGLSFRRATLRSIPHHIPVAEGSILYSSSFSGVYPSDIPLGVCGPSSISSDGTQNVVVELYEDPALLRYVTIVRAIHSDEIEKFDNE